MSIFPRRVFAGVCLAVLFCSLGGGIVCAEDAPGAPLHALLVGGGPDVANNAAQIEGHVRFVASLQSPSSTRVVLFADGKTDEPTVSCADTRPSADARRALAVLLADHDADEPVLTRPARTSCTTRWVRTCSRRSSPR